MFRLPQGKTPGQDATGIPAAPTLPYPLNKRTASARQLPPATAGKIAARRRYPSQVGATGTTRGFTVGKKGTSGLCIGVLLGRTRAVVIQNGALSQIFFVVRINIEHTAALDGINNGAIETGGQGGTAETAP